MTIYVYFVLLSLSFWRYWLRKQMFVPKMMQKDTKYHIKDRDELEQQS